jgi:hypothetical protein
MDDETSNNGSNWNHFKIIQKILYQKIKEVKETAILGSTHILQKLPM